MAHGRVLLKASYQVRNERRQFLQVVPPAGFEVLGVRVAGQTAQPVSGQGCVYVPLEKSVESVRGLVGFPVEVYFLGEEQAWARRGRRVLATPSVDAPVAYARWEVFLPRDLRLRGEPRGSAKAVDWWSEGQQVMSYGRAWSHGGGSVSSGAEEILLSDELESASRGRFAVGAGLSLRSRARRAPASGDEGRVAVQELEQRQSGSLELFNQAYQAYKGNRFEEAGALLDQSIELDPYNDGAQALRANVSLFVDDGQGEQDKDDAQARRVRDLARAKTADVQIEQEKSSRKVEQYLRQGDLADAERELEVLTAVTVELQRYEQGESSEQQLILEDALKTLNEVRSKRKKVWQNSAEMVVDAAGASPSDERAYEGLVRGSQASAAPTCEVPADDSAVVAQGLSDILLDELLLEDDMVMGHMGVTGTMEMGGGEGAGADAPESALLYDEGEELLAHRFVTLVREAPAQELVEPQPVLSSSTGQLIAAAPPSPSKAAVHSPQKSPRVRKAAFAPKPAVQVPQTVTASHLVINLPQTSEPLRFEQRLVTAGSPLVVEIRYRSRRKP